MVLSGCSQTKQDYPHLPSPGDREPTEIEVKRHNHTLIDCGPFKDCIIRQSTKTGIHDMNSVMPFAAEPFRQNRRKVHVEQETHSSASSRDHLLPGQPSRIPESLTNVLGFDIGIILEDLFVGDAVRNE